MVPSEKRDDSAFGRLGWGHQDLRLLWQLPWLAFGLAVSLSTTARAADQSCYPLSDRLKAILGIESGFDTRLRVEHKSTNSPTQAEGFVRLLQSSIDPRHGESFVLRDRPSDPSQVLVTSTTYPFDRRVQNHPRIRARIRIRQYGERSAGSDARFRSTGNGIVSLEIKARTAQFGVVVKPIIKIQGADLIPLFTDGATIRAGENALAERLTVRNGGEEPLVREIVNTVREFHDVSESLGLPLFADNIEYQRQAYVVQIFDRAIGAYRQVQITFDRAVTLRSQVDAKELPWESSRLQPTLRYPDGADGVVVIEMKSDLEIDRRYRTDPQSVLRDATTYYHVRHAYERLQREVVPGFAPDRGKAAQLSEAAWER